MRYFIFLHNKPAYTIVCRFFLFLYPIIVFAEFGSPRTENPSHNLWLNVEEKKTLDSYCINKEYTRLTVKIPMCDQILPAIKITKKNADICKSKGDLSFLNCIAGAKNAVLNDSIVASCNKIENKRVLLKKEISTFGQCVSYFIHTSSKFQTEAVEECTKNNFYDIDKALICFDIIRDKELPEKTFREPKAVCKSDNRINLAYNECLRSQTLALPTYCETQCIKKQPSAEIEIPKRPLRRKKAI